MELISGSNAGSSRAAAGRAAQVAPIDVGAKFLASDAALCGALDIRAVFRGHAAGRDPLLDRLVTPHLEGRGSLDDAADKLDGALNWCSGVHALHCMPEKLAIQGALAQIPLFPVLTREIPALPQEKPVHTIRRMETIHARIKRLRTAKGMSMAALASKVGLRSWQTVQQWESETKPTAPARKHQEAVAAVLGVSVEELMHGSSPHPAQTIPADSVEVRVVQLAALRDAVRAMADAFGVSPEDLVSDRPAARERVADAVGEIERERVASSGAMPRARPSTQEARERVSFQVSPETQPAQAPARGRKVS